MLLPTVHLQLICPPCLPGAEKWSAKATLEDDIGQVLPYLNAGLKGAVYNHAASVLIMEMGRHKVAVRPREIAISNLPDREAAATEMQRVVDLINRTWERRADLTPDFRTHQRPTPMAVFKLLPQTNCRKCGEPTCFAFALKVLASEKAVADCPPLLDPTYADQRAALQALVTDLRDPYVAE
jgi:ArsR family metal-binding transcriptional regulator